MSDNNYRLSNNSESFPLFFAISALPTYPLILRGSILIIYSYILLASSCFPYFLTVNALISNAIILLLS